MILVRFIARHHAPMATIWTVLLVALAGSTVGAYQSTYTTNEQRREAATLARDNPATTLLYGRLDPSGSPASMFTWEIGAYLTILAAVMGVIVAVSMTRAGEDDGMLELIATTGVRRSAPLLTAFGLQVAIAGALWAGCAGAVGVTVGRVDGITWTGAVMFGAVIGTTFLLFATITTVVAQIAPTAQAARLLGSATIAVSFAIRACADDRQVGWLQWASPLALRETMQPFTHDRWWTISVYGTVTIMLAGVARALERRRDYGNGLIAVDANSASRLLIRSCPGFVVRLTRRSVLIWSTGVAAFGALIAAMGSGVVDMAGSGRLDGGFLGSQFDQADPVASYFSYTGDIVAIIVSVFAVQTVLASHRADRARLTDHLLSTGLRRWTPLGSHVVVVGIGTFVVLAATAALSALIAPRAMSGADVAARAAGHALGQWPSILAVTGVSALVIGLAPRAVWLAWVPVVASSVATLLGPLLKIPDGIRNLSLYGHVPDIATTELSVSALTPSVVLVAIGAATAGLGLASISRRDIG